jgi:hypothetical protein
MPHAYVSPPSIANGKPIPLASRATLIAARVASIGWRFAFSKSFTVDRPTRAAFARSSCDQASQARADLHCSGVILSG